MNFVIAREAYPYFSDQLVVALGLVEEEDQSAVPPVCHGPPVGPPVGKHDLQAEGCQTRQPACVSSARHLVAGWKNIVEKVRVVRFADLVDAYHGGLAGGRFRGHKRVEFVEGN